MMLSTILDAYGIDDLRWDTGISQWRYPSGKAVSERQLFLLRKREGDRVNKAMQKLTDKLLKKEIALDDWQRQIASMVRDTHVANMRLGRGGKERTALVHYGEVGRELKQNQYPRLKALAQKVKSGEISEKMLRHKLSLYAKSGKVSYERGVLSRKVDEGEHWGRRLLGSCANHCPECISYSLQGWLPLPQVKPIAVDCSCGVNCCCQILTRRYPPMEEMGRRVA